MVWREDRVSGSTGVSSHGTAQGGSATKITMMLVIISFLMVTVVLLALQPRTNTDAPQVIAEPVRVTPAPPAPLPETEAPLPVVAAVQSASSAPAPRAAAPIVVEPEVSRADASLLELRQAVASPETSVLLRQVAPQGVPLDLQVLARTVLRDFGYPAVEGDRLHGLLVGALSNQKSDAFIDALLNTAAARGAYTPPAALTLPTGRLNTRALLEAMLIAAQS